MPGIALRATFFLPVTTVDDRTAYLRVIDFLRSTDLGLGGFTTTTHNPAVLRGFYWSERLAEWVLDDIVVAFVDLTVRDDSEEVAARAKIRTIKGRIEAMYEEEGSKQEEVWCTLERIEVI